MFIRSLFAASTLAAIATGAAIALAPMPIVQLVAFHDGQAYILYADMPFNECVDSALAAGLQCLSHEVLPRLPLFTHGPSRETPSAICAALLTAAQYGAPDGYARAESNCGRIY